jgi:separase
MGMINSSPLPLTAPAQEVVGILSNAEQLFWSDLQLLARRGTVSHVRAAAVSLAMIGALRSSFGNASPQAPLLAARLIGE